MHAYVLRKQEKRRNRTKIRKCDKGLKRHVVHIHEQFAFRKQDHHLF